jgi:hypothetical protein
MSGLSVNTVTKVADCVSFQEFADYQDNIQFTTCEFAVRTE